MINLKFFRTILIFIFFASTCNAENIAYANLDTIVNTSEVGKKIISNFAKKNNKLLESFKADEQKIKEKEKKIISQKNILQENEYLNKVNLLRNEVKVFNESNNKKLNDLRFNRDKVLDSFLKEINKILSEFSEKNKIDLILSSNQIIIGKSNLDVTKNILIIVNKKFKTFKIE